MAGHDTHVATDAPRELRDDEAIQRASRMVGGDDQRSSVRKRPTLSEVHANADVQRLQHPALECGTRRPARLVVDHTELVDAEQLLADGPRGVPRRAGQAGLGRDMESERIARGVDGVGH